MKQKYMVLRASKLGVRGAFRGDVVQLEEAASNMTLHIEDIEHREALALKREDDVWAVAPSMPMRLIEPYNVGDVGAPPTAGPTWGVSAVKADTSPFTGAGVTIAVLDTGIDATHPIFAGVELVEKDFSGEGNGDKHGHGTHCAGTIFGRTVGGVRVGVAPGVTRALIGKVLGEDGGSSAQIQSAIEWAVENGAHVISMSLGMDFPGLVKYMVESDSLPVDLATSRALEGYRANILLFERLATLLRVRAQTSIIIAAAGNESRRHIDKRYEIAVSPPAVSEGIISVGAVKKGDDGMSIADFSNTGPTICAPGVEIVSARHGGGTVVMSGTSMATPHAAGVAALWAEKIRRKSPVMGTQLAARLTGMASLDGLRAGYDPVNVGAGVVLAPQG